MYSNSLVALISPNNKVLRELAKSLNKGKMSRREWCGDEEITQIVLDSINQTGKRAKLKDKEMPVRITLTAEEWTPDNNLLTAAFKLKRKNVYEYYSADIKRMFGEVQSESQAKAKNSKSSMTNNNNTGNIGGKTPPVTPVRL